MRIRSLFDEFKDMGLVKDVQYNIFSSITEPFPKACVTITTSYVTPDALGLHKGKSVPLTLQLDSSSIQLPDFVIDYTQTEGTSAGQTTKVYLRYRADLAEIVNVRASYKNKNAYDVVMDVLSNDSYLSSYNKIVEKSDHPFNSFRVLGDSSVEFITNTVCKNSLVDNGKPYFFIGLDNTAYFVSTNSCAKKGDNVKGFIRCSGKQDNKSISLGLEQKSVDRKNVVDLLADTYTIDVGSAVTSKDLKVKNYVYAPTNILDVKSVTATTMQLGDKDGSKYPIMDDFLTFTDATDSALVQNRPGKNVQVEMYNELADKLSQLITCSFKNCTMSFPEGVESLVSAGNQVYVQTLYEYSALNGLYVVRDVEYMQMQGAATCTITATRSFLDVQFADNKTDMEIQGDSLYDLSPVCNKEELLG